MGPRPDPSLRLPRPVRSALAARSRVLRQRNRRRAGWRCERAWTPDRLAGHRYGQRGCRDAGQGRGQGGGYLRGPERRSLRCARQGRRSGVPRSRRRRLGCGAVVRADPHRGDRRLWGVPGGGAGRPARRTPWAMGTSVWGAIKGGGGNNGLARARGGGRLRHPHSQARSSSVTVRSPRSGSNGQAMPAMAESSARPIAAAAVGPTMCGQSSPRPGQRPTTCQPPCAASTISTSTRPPRAPRPARPDGSLRRRPRSRRGTRSRRRDGRAATGPGWRLCGRAACRRVGE
jgi:hypothetical protein